MSERLANALAGIPEDPWVEDQPLVTTADALAYRDPYEQEVAEYQRNLLAAQDRHGLEALSRLFMTAMAPAAAVHRAGTAANVPMAYRAAKTHNRLEEKQGNPLVNWATKPFLTPFLTMTAPYMARALRREPATVSDKLQTPLKRATDNIENVNLLKEPHITDTANILNRLYELNSGASKLKTVY